MRLKTRTGLRSVKGSVCMYLIPDSQVTDLPQPSQKVKDLFCREVNQIGSRPVDTWKVWEKFSPENEGTGNILNSETPSPLYCSASQAVAAH